MNRELLLPTGLVRWMGKGSNPGFAMVRVSFSRRLTALAALLALLLFPGESAKACDHGDHSDYGDHAVTSTGAHGDMAGGSHPCHDPGTPSHEGQPLADSEMGDGHDSKPLTECCSGGCCASSGIPPGPALVESGGGPTCDQPMWSPSSLITGEPTAVFRPPAE